MRAMRPRHVRDVGRIPAATGEVGVRRDPPAGHEDFDGGRRDARLDARVHELIRHAVPVVRDVDVIVDVDATRLPCRQLVPMGRQRAKRWPIELLEERPPTDAHDLHRLGVDRVEARANRDIQVREREEGLMAEHRQDPPLRDLHAHFDFGFGESCQLRLMRMLRINSSGSPIRFTR